MLGYTRPAFSRSASDNSIEGKERAATRMYWVDCLDKSQDELRRKEINRLKVLNDSLEDR